MYQWKCWREYRGFALLCLAVVAGVVLWMDHTILNYVLYWHSFGCSHLTSLEEAQQRFSLYMMNTMLITLGGWVASICVGAAGGIGREFDGRLSDLLFSRPVRRRRVLWINWLGAIITVEAVQVAATLLSCGYCFLGMRADTMFRHWPYFLLVKELRAILLMLPLNMLILGIATCGAVLLRGSSKGTLTAGGALCIYAGVIAAYARTHSAIAPAWWFDGLLSAMNVNVSGPMSNVVFPVALFFGWTAAALLFPFAAQLILERRDVA